MCLLLTQSKQMMSLSTMSLNMMSLLFSSEQTRWVEAINPPHSDKGGETIYEAWGELR